jgi:hypothetical protein
MNLATVGQSFSSFLPDTDVPARTQSRNRVLPNAAQRRVHSVVLTRQSTWMARTESAFWWASIPMILALVLFPVFWR